MIELFNLPDESDFIDGPVDGDQPPAAGPWIKVEPGCEMPEVGAWKRSGPLVAVVEEGGDRRVVSCHYSEGHKYISDGFKCYGAAIEPTHYAVVRMPEGSW